MNKLVKNTSLYAISNFTSKGINFVLLPIYTSHMSPSEFGVVNSMQVLTLVLLIILTFGLERGIYRLYFDHKSESQKKTFLGTTFLSIVIISSVLCGIVFLSRSGITKIYNSISFHPYFTYAILTAVFMTYELVPKISLQVKEKATQYLLLSLLLLIFRVVPILWQVVILENEAEGMLKGTMIGNACTLLFLVPLTIQHTVLKFDLKIFISTLRYCLPLVPMLLSAWIVNMSDRIFIEHYYSTFEVGIYSLGYKIGQLVQFVSISVLMAYNPYYYKLANSELSRSDVKERLYKINNYIIITILSIAFIIAFFARDLITLFFDKSYHDAYQIIPLIALGYFFMQLVSLQNLSFYQEKKTTALMKINIVAALLNITFNFILISKLGYLGASISTVITQFLFFIVTYTYAKKFFFIPYNWKLIVPMLIIYTSAAILSTVLTYSNVLLFIIKIFVLLFFITFFLIKNRRKLVLFLRKSKL